MIWINITTERYKKLYYNIYGSCNGYNICCRDIYGSIIAIFESGPSGSVQGVQLRFSWRACRRWFVGRFEVVASFSAWIENPCGCTCKFRIITVFSSCRYLIRRQWNPLSNERDTLSIIAGNWKRVDWLPLIGLGFYDKIVSRSTDVYVSLLADIQTNNNTCIKKLFLARIFKRGWQN